MPRQRPLALWPLPRPLRPAGVELCLLDQRRRSLELLAGELDRVPVQLDLGAQLFAVAAPEPVAAGELALGSLQSSLCEVARLGERAAFLLEETEVQPLVRA